MGKGDKQRLVPISETAIQEINNWLIYRGQIYIKKGYEDIVFVSSRRGTALSRITVFILLNSMQRLQVSGKMLVLMFFVTPLQLIS